MLVAALGVRKALLFKVSDFGSLSPILDVLILSSLIFPALVVWGDLVRSCKDSLLACIRSKILIFSRQVSFSLLGELNKDEVNLLALCFVGEPIAVSIRGELGSVLSQIVGWQIKWMYFCVSLRNSIVLAC